MHGLWRASGACPGTALTTETSKLDPQLCEEGRDVSSVGRIAGKGTVSRSGKESRRSGRDARRDVLSSDVGDVDFRRLKRDAQKLLDFLHGRHDLSSALGGVAPVAVTTGFSFSKKRKYTSDLVSACHSETRGEGTPPGSRLASSRGRSAWRTMCDGETPAALLAKLQARNRREVDAFRAVFEAHAVAQRQIEDAAGARDGVAAPVRRARGGQGERRGELEDGKRGCSASIQPPHASPSSKPSCGAWQARGELPTSRVRRTGWRKRRRTCISRERRSRRRRERDAAIARGDDLDAALEAHAAARHAAAEAASRLAGRDEAWREPRAGSRRCWWSA